MASDTTSALSEGINVEHRKPGDLDLHQTDAATFHFTIRTPLPPADLTLTAHAMISCYGKRARILIKCWRRPGHRPETMLVTAYKLNNSAVFSLLNPRRLGYKKEDYNLGTREIRQRPTPVCSASTCSFLRAAGSKFVGVMQIPTPFLRLIGN